MTIIRAVRRSGILAAALISACGAGDTVRKSELDAVRAGLDAEVTRRVAELRREFQQLQTRFEQISALAEKLEVMRQDLEKLSGAIRADWETMQRRLDITSGEVVKSLQLQEQLLKQQIESVRALLEELKK